MKCVVKLVIAILPSLSFYLNGLIISMLTLHPSVIALGCVVDILHSAVMTI